MIDNVTQARIGLLHPRIREDVNCIYLSCLDKNVSFRIVQGYRTIAEQNNLFSQGRTQTQLLEAGLKGVLAKPNLQRVTNAIGGTSWHNFGLAFDFCLLKKDKSISWSRTDDLDKDNIPDWTEIVQTAMARGFDWGGNWNSFPDYPHLQKVFGLTILKAKDLISKGKVDINGYIII